MLPYPFRLKFHPAQEDPRMGGPVCRDLGHDPETCEEGVILNPEGRVAFTAECMQCGHEPLVYEDRKQRNDEVAKHVETAGHSVAIGWTEIV